MGWIRHPGICRSHRYGSCILSARKSLFERNGKREIHRSRSGGQISTRIGHCLCKREILSDPTGRWGFSGPFPKMHTPRMYSSLDLQQESVRMSLPFLGLRHPGGSGSTTRPQSPRHASSVYREQRSQGRYSQVDKKGTF